MQRLETVMMKIKHSDERWGDRKGPCGKVTLELNLTFS